MGRIRTRTRACIALAAALACAAATTLAAHPARAAGTPVGLPEPEGDAAEELDRPLPLPRSGPSVLEVENVEQLDLSQLRAIIAAAAPIDERADVEVRELTLEECLQLALVNNLDVQVTQVGVDIGEAGVAEQKARFHPTFGASGEADGWSRARSGGRPDETRSRQRALLFLEQEVPTGGFVRLGAGYEREKTAENEQADQQQNFVNSNELAGLSIEVFQPLLRGGRVFVARSQIIDSEYGAEINQAMLATAMLTVKARVKAAYYNVIRANQQVDVAERALERANELVEASDALFDAGQVSKVDVFSADVRTATAEARLTTANAERRVRRNELRRVIGLPVGIEILAAERAIPFEPVPVDLSNWIARAMRNRPELLQKRAELRQAELAKRVAGNGKLPELGVNGTFQPGFDWASYNWDAGLSFRMPIGNRAPRARYREAEGVRSVAQTELFRTQRDIELEVREFEIRLRENLGRIESLSHAVESARKKREVALGRFEMGLASNLQVVNANEELIRSESDLLAAITEYASNIAFLEAAIGGQL